MGQAAYRGSRVPPDASLIAPFLGYRWATKGEETVPRLTLLNGSVANTGGYWIDRHGHYVLVRAGQPLPGCPRRPGEITFWQLSTEIAPNKSGS